MGDGEAGSGEVEVPPGMAGHPAAPDDSAGGGVPAAEVPLQDVSAHDEVPLWNPLGFRSLQYDVTCVSPPLHLSAALPAAAARRGGAPAGRQCSQRGAAAASALSCSPIPPDPLRRFSVASWHLQLPG